MLDYRSHTALRNDVRNHQYHPASPAAEDPTFPPAKQRRLDQLLQKNAQGALTAAEKKRIEARRRREQDGSAPLLQNEAIDQPDDWESSSKLPH